jgi:hypothetical protein
MSTAESHEEGLSPLELMRIASLNEAAHLSGISKDSLRKYHRSKLIALGPRRLGMRVKDALMLSEDDS